MSKLTPPIAPSDHVVGPADALVTLTEYGDYECPFCGRAHLVVQQVLSEMRAPLRFVFRNFPLAQAHPHALLAAEAAESAGGQGKFWPMHDILYEHQHALEPDDLLAYAAALRLDVARFAEDLQSHANLERVKRDFRSGVRSGVNGTPTFFIDDDRHDGGWDPYTLRAALETAIRAKLRRPDPGQRDEFYR